MIFALLLSMLTGCSNEESNRLIASANISIMQGNPEILKNDDSISFKLNKDENAQVTFSRSALDKGEFFVVNIKFSGDNKIYAKILGPSYDINKDSVFEKCNGAGEFQRVIKSDNKGNCDFSVSLINKDSDIFEGKISHVEIKPIVDCSDYRLYSSNDKSVKILLCKDDVSKSECSDKAIVKWLDNLAIIRKTLNDFSGYGMDEVVYCATQEFDHYGLAGNPININRKYVVDDLKTIMSAYDKEESSSEIMWGYVHEMAHVADGFGYGKIADRIFDSELSAQLESAYVITINGFKYPNGKSAVEFFSDHTNLSNGVYSDESFLYRLFQILQPIDRNLNGLKQSLLSTEYKSNMSDYEKLNVFFNQLKKFSGQDIFNLFTEKEQQAIKTKFIDGK